MPLNDLISKAKKSKLYSTISKVVSTIDRDKEKEGFQLVPGGTSGAIQRVKQSFNDPGQYSITRGFSNIVPNTKTALTPFLGQQTASNIAYGLRGASQLTPFQAVNSLGIDKIGQFNYQSSAPQTQQEKDAQQIGRATYGLALTAPLGGANMAKNVLGRAVTGAGAGAAIGAGISAVTGGDIAQGAKQGAMSGYSFAPLGAITNPITSKLLAGAPSVLQNQVGQRAIGGVANVVEDELQGMIDGYDTDTQSRITSLLVGAALTGNKDAWNLTKRKLKSLNVKNADDLIKVAETRLSEAYKDQGAIRLSWFEPDGSRRAVTVDKATQPGWIMYLNNRGVDYKLNFVGGSLGSVGGAPKPPTNPLEALKVEARKYKTTVNLQDKNDLEYLERIFSKSTIEDILNGQKTNWRGESYEDLARVNFISKTPKTIEQQLSGKIKDIKLKSDTFYHGTSANSAREIMGSGFKSGSELPKNAYRGGGYGKIQEGVSFAETPKEAGIFSTLTRDGEIVEAKLKKGAKVVTIDGVEDAVELADYTKYLKKQGVDAVYIGGGEKELVVLNTKAVTPVKSQLTDLYSQSQLPKSEAIKGKVQSQSLELPKQVAQTTSSPSLDTTRTGNIPTTQVKQAQTLPIQQDSRLTGVDTKLDTNQNLKIKTTKVSSNESIPPTLKPKTKLLKQAEELRNTGFQELTANRELAQLNQVKREMFTSKQIEDINRLKTIARSNKALEGDIETLRKLTPDGLTDRVLEYVEEATAIKGQGNEEQLLETALSLPTKADTKVKLPVEIKNARELEKQASKLRDLVYNSETDPNIKAKAVADNQKVIQKSAVADYKEWEKQLFKQESAKRMTPNRQATIASSQIRTSTKPEFAKPENISKTQDISNAGKGMTDVYRNVDRVFGKDSQVRKQILAPFDTAKASMVDDLEREATGLETNIVKKYGFTKGSAESEYIQKYGEGLVTKPQLVERFGKKKAEQIIEANTWFRSQYDRLLDEVNAVRARIYPNNPEKQIPKRKDYYRHFQDLSSSLAGLKNLFENPAGIEPGLAGVSEYTVPKSKWLSFAQKRLGMKTEYDAVGGYLDYVGSQTYAKRIDPFIEKFRTLRQELVDATSIEGDKNYGKLNNFIEFLDDYANDLAGKTNPADRVAQKYMGRKVFKILNWVNSRTKANVIVGNLSSSIAQFFNIPQGVAEAGVVNSGKGAVRTLGSILDNTNTPITKSEFIKTRFSKDISDRFDVGVLSSVKKAASWITSVGDEIGTKLIWNSVYEKAISQNIENPIKYADDITRKMVAGRGIGEVPLLQKAKVFQLVAPFQLEVSNVWHVMRDWAGEKSANKFVTFFVASYLMNRVAERIRGNDVSLDPIQAGLESIEAYNEEDDKTLGVLRAGGRLFGEVLSNLPGGQTVAAMYPEYGSTIGDTKLPTREKLFGEGDPTRFGSGLLASKGLTDPLYKIIPPYGGAQIKKTIEGLGTVNKGYSESKTGRVRFPVDKNLINTVQAGAFGQYSVSEAREYFGNETSTLGEKQSESYKTILTTQGKEAATNFYNGILRKRGKDVELKPGESSNDITVIESKFENTPDLLTNDEIATFYEAKITKPKSANKYEKAIYERDIWSKASDINSRESLSQEQKDGAITKLLSNIGVSKEDYDYYQVAKETNDLKTLKVYDVYDQTKDYDEFMKYLVNGRKPVNGKILISDGVIDNLVDDGLIPYALGKDLKSIDLNEDGSVKTGKIRAKSSKANTDSIKAYSNALQRLGDSLLKVNIKAPTVTSTSTNKINTKGLTFSSAGF